MKCDLTVSAAKCLQFSALHHGGQQRQHRYYGNEEITSLSPYVYAMFKLLKITLVL